MEIVFPLFAFILLFLFFRSLFSKTQGIRLAWVLSSLTISLLIVLSVETLNFFNSINHLSLVIFWGLAILVLLSLLFWKKPKRISFTWRVYPNRFLNTLSALIPSVLGMTTFIIAIVAPPNNTDSMVYHLSRVAHWAQNQSLAPYATSTLRELFLNPFAEYAMLHTYVLASSDRFVNLVQWFSYINVAIVVSLIAEQLGAGKKGQYLSSLFALSLPQSILQATSTQNDLTFSGFVLLAVYFIFRVLQGDDQHWIIPAAIAAALAILTKSTSFIFLAPFLVILALFMIRKWKLQDYWKAVVAILFAIFMIFPYYARNYQTFGSLLGPKSETGLYLNDEHNLKVFTSNSVRNLAINFTYTTKTSLVLETTVKSFHQWLGISESDPATTWQNYQFTINSFSANEDNSGSPLHIWLIFLVFVFMILARKKFPQSAHLLALCVICSFILFSLLLKWQPWNNRLELVMFLLSAPLFGLAVEKFKMIPEIFALILAICSTPYFLFNTTKPLTQDWNIFNLPRAEMMLRKKDLLAPYINSTIYINKNLQCENIGLEIENGYWEYPFWYFLRNPDTSKHNLYHINTDNESSYLETQIPEICAIILVDENNKPDEITYTTQWYELSYDEDLVAVYSLK